jgi:8-oxo-dGTP pyrophosphatase MutT (NUDIX family)
VEPGGPGFEGDWAWTPPSGGREPGESEEETAARELREEAGLHLPLRRVPFGSTTVALFVAEAPPGDDVVLDADHDEHEWVSLHEACARCRPAGVADCVRAAAEAIG